MAEKNNIKNVYSLSPMQEGMLFHALLDEQPGAYMEQTVITLRGDVDPLLFNNAFQELIQRYDILRTVFVYKTTKRPRQVVMEKQEAPFVFEDISNRPIDACNDYIERAILKDRENLFDLTQGPLLRLYLFKTSSDSWKSLWTFHHILMDGWCLGILFREFIELYISIQENTLPRFAPVVPYSQYIQWLEKQDKQAGMNYWKSYLEGYEGLASIPRTGNTDKAKTYQPGKHRYICDTVLSGEIRRISKENQVTLNTLFLVLWGILLQRYTNSDDVVFGAVVSGRPAGIKNVESIVGLFINTVPVRIKINSTINTTDTGDSGNGACKVVNSQESSISFIQLLKAVHTETALARSYEYLPLADIQSECGIKNQLFDHIIAFENYPLDENIKQSAANTPQNSSKENIFSVDDLVMHEQTNYTFNLLVTPGSNLIVDFLYNGVLYENEFVENLSLQMGEMIKQVGNNPAIPINEIDILTEQDKERLLNEFNSNASRYRIDKTLHGLFEEQVEKTPDNIALTGIDESSFNQKPFATVLLTYRMLDEVSNKLAVDLQSQGAGPGAVVAISMDRSINLIIGILGILKSGSAYLPIDKSSPQDRIDYMMKDSRVSVSVNCVCMPPASLLSCKKVGKELLLRVDYGHWNNENNYAMPNDSSQPTHTPTHTHTKTAYIIYTSGTTGKPKGVPITHSNLSPLLHWGYDLLGINTNDRALQNLSYYFDWSVWEIFVTITSGAGLYMLHDTFLLDVEKCTAFMKTHDITVFHATPTRFHYFTQTGQKLDTLKYLFIGAEKLTYDLVQNSFEKVSKDCRVFNMYGPTEATIISAALEIERDEYESFKTLSSIPIGKPSGNSILLILDKHSRLCPILAAGELFIGGESVANGYLNKPVLTSERFVSMPSASRFLKKAPQKLLIDKKNIYANPCSSVVNYSTFYKTGDLSRWLPDGYVEFLGRIDHQVKIRGFRIELGEIENHILSFEGITGTVVIVKDYSNGDKYLCAYIVSKFNEKDFQPALLKTHLSQFLPDYMIPAYFILIPYLPLNPNGKVDIKSLPLPGTDTERLFNAPRDLIEQKLVEIWGEILGKPSANDSLIGIDDNFFDLGGHSLRAMSLISRIHKDLNIKISLQDIFSSPTIREFAAVIREAKKEAGEESFRDIEPTEEMEYYPLSSSQKRLYIFQQMEANNTGYNIPLLLELTGKVDIKRIEDTFKRLIRRHESLRTSFHNIEGLPVQRIHPDVDFSIPYEERLNQPFDESVILDFIAPFDLKSAPLVRVKLIKIEELKHILMVDIHHIITDGVSMNFVAKEILRLYFGEELPPLRLQFKDYASWFNRVWNRKREVYRRQETFWLRQMQGQIPLLRLPYDFERPSVQSYKGDYISVYFNEEENLKLKEIASQTETTYFMVLLSLCYLWLHKISGQEDIIIGTPIEGRNHHDLKGIMGMFVNTLALRNSPHPSMTFLDFLKEVKTRTLDVFDNQDYLFEDLVNILDYKTEPGRNPIFDVLFTLLNIPDQSPKPVINPGNIPGVDMNENIDIKHYHYRSRTAKFDLAIEAEETRDNCLIINVDYTLKLFKADTVKRFGDYLKEIVAAVTGDLNILIRDITISHGLVRVETENPDMDLEF